MRLRLIRPRGGQELSVQIEPAMRLPWQTLRRAWVDGELRDSIAHYLRRHKDGGLQVGTGHRTPTPDLVPEVKIACRKEGEKIACGPAHLPREGLGYSVVLSADREVHPRAQSAAASKRCRPGRAQGVWWRLCFGTAIIWAVQGTDMRFQHVLCPRQQKR